MFIECGGDQNHPRYSTLSDSRMSTSSQGADSTPSANSVLSDSLLVQSADSLPETTTAATGLPLGSSGSQDEDRHQLVFVLDPALISCWLHLFR